MRIGELAERTDVPTRTIRYYESIELLAEPPRTAAGYRQYDESDVDRLRFVREAQASGLTLSEVASVLELKDAGARSCEHTRDLLARHIVEIDEQIARLGTARAKLLAMAERADALDPGDCTDPQRCQVITGAGSEGP